MCGILGVVATSPVNQLLYDGLQVLQHRGQDAAGIATSRKRKISMHKNSLVRDVFRTRNMRSLVGQWGIGHCRYPTAGSAYNPAEAQRFLCQFAVWPDARTQRQFGRELRTAKTRHVPAGLAAHEYELGFREILLNVFGA